MKKLIIAAVILLVLGVLAYAFFGGGKTAAEKPASTEPAEISEPAGDEQETESLGMEAMYALHEPDEIIMTIDGKPVSWNDYMYFYQSQASQLEQQFQMYQAYGMALGWNSIADEEGHTYAELMGQSTEDTLRQLFAVEGLAEDLGAELTEEEKAEMQQNHQDLIVSRFGEEGTEEQLYEFLDTLHVSPELYWRINSYGYLYEACMRELCGENGEKLNEQQILTWMEDNGILSADHILISTTDLEEADKEKKADLASEIAAELQAIEDAEARMARFLELKDLYNEDPGTVEKGYVFGPGSMVEEFYNGTLALEENQISDPVESEYGYHIILRRPLNTQDEIVSGYYTYTPRQLAADDLFTAALSEKLDSLQVVYANGFQAPNLADFLDIGPAEK